MRISKIYTEQNKNGNYSVRLAEPKSAEMGVLSISSDRLYYLEVTTVEGLEINQEIPEFDLSAFEQVESTYHYTNDAGEEVEGHATWLTLK